MVGLQTLDLAIGVRVPASQPTHPAVPDICVTKRLTQDI